MGLQKGMRELVRVMSEDFERVYASSEDIKKLMQNVYNTFTTRFGFQKMVLPSLDLELHRTKLKLLVVDTDQFAKDPLNVIATEKHFLVKKFYRTLVNQARSIFMDAKVQSERWIQAVTMPLETQIKDHKQLLQSRLDNLAKINEKTTTDQRADGRVQGGRGGPAQAARHDRGPDRRASRRSRRARRSPTWSEPPMPRGRGDDHAGDDAHARLRASPASIRRPSAPRRRSPRRPPRRPVAAPATPMISDDLLSQFARSRRRTRSPRSAWTMPSARSACRGRRDHRPAREAPRQYVPSDGGPAPQPVPNDGGPQTEPMGAEAEEPERTQRLEPEASPEFQRTQRMSATEGDKTVKVSKLDPNWRPDSPEPLPTPGTDVKDATTTQRLDDSIQRLQEAKRLLQNLKGTRPGSRRTAPACRRFRPASRSAS